jgi:hypothetical protein
VGIGDGKEQEFEGTEKNQKKMKNDCTHQSFPLEDQGNHFLFFPPFLD